MDGKHRVFIVDDDQDLVEIMRSVMEAAGYEVVTAGSAREAMERMEAASPHVILLDVMMEDTVAGFRVVNFLRDFETYPQNRKYEKIPIMMLTSIQQRTGMKFSQDAGSRLLPIDAFIEKPIKPRALLDRVAQLLAQQ
ncbi:MAG: response regulator [Deltaproteobacteria bacterium]|nr:response regulator [Deltaproteobacteria bacterium]